MSDQIEWLKIAASIVGGGFAGAILTNIVTAHRSRIQPVGRRIDVTPLFTPGFASAPLKPTVTISDGTRSYEFSNLHLAELNIVNRGNRDFTNFRFGLTLSATDTCVHAEPTESDRHHVATLATAITPATPSSILDFTLEPFNRGDAYTIKLFIVAGGIEPESIIVSSAESVRFADIPSLAETLGDIASTMTLKLGPVNLTIPR